MANTTYTSSSLYHLWIVCNFDIVHTVLLHEYEKEIKRIHYIFFVSFVVILLILYVIFLWYSAPDHSPSSKELIPFSQDNARFSGRWIIPLWDAATAHSPSGKELIFLGLLFGNLLTLFCLVSYLASFVCYSPILLIKSICAFILYVVYAYSERPSLSKILYFIFGLFLKGKTTTSKIFYSMCFLFQWRKTATLQKSVAKTMAKLAK